MQLGKMSKVALFAGILIVSVIASINVGAFMGFNLWYDLGYKNGVRDGIHQTVEVIETRTGIKVAINELSNGSYTFIINYDSPLSYGVNFTLHLTATHIRNGTVLSTSYHPMTLTTFGKNWLADNIAQRTGSLNQSKYAEYLGTSNDSSAFSAAWTAIPNEITDGGLERAQGVYTDTGTGTFDLDKSFSVTLTRSTKLYGLYIDSYTNWVGGGLVAAEQQGTSNQKNFNNGDTLNLKVQGTITQ